MSDELLTVREAAARLRVSSDSVYGLIRENAGFPAAKVGGLYRIPADALEAWISEQVGIQAEEPTAR